MMNYKFYLIETLTNTHVGSGENTFGTVNNMIQKDEITGTPIFHASGIKGALKETLNNNNDFNKDLISELFGEEGKNDKTDDKKSIPGKLKFFDAQLITLPLRANRNVFYNVTSAFLLEEFFKFYGMLKSVDHSHIIEWLKELNQKKEFFIFENLEKLEIEDYKNYEYKKCNDRLKNIFEEKKYFNLPEKNIAIFNDDLFKNICKNNLPVVARNKIGKDGTSENLFHEEVLPRRSKLWFALGFNNENEKEVNNFKKFHDYLISENTLFQIGGNSSIGYGLCKFSELNFNGGYSEQN